MVNRRLLRTKILRALYGHLSNSNPKAEKSLALYSRSVKECYLLHLFILQLLVEVKNYAIERQTIAASKFQATFDDLNPKKRFVQNPIIKNIENNEELQDRLANSGVSWGNHQEVIREIYNQIIESDRYKSYQDGTGSERDFILYILKNLIEDNHVVEQALEDMSILWVDDLGYALGESIFVVEKHLEKGVIDQFKYPDDKEYGESLLMHAISRSSIYLNFLEEHCEKWEMERIAFMDKVLFVLATSELVSCENIPVKVTLNEYIEISKYYSTPSSYNFLNGMLHKAIDSYTEQGKIQKSGMGLLDHKVTSKN